ncbi:hypothetical protein LP420_29530 [Massilia sp. B-10]|nr:hypothetical protein LP420_29530 [Massilia sp. B-10]
MRLSSRWAGKARIASKCNALIDKVGISDDDAALAWDRVHGGIVRAATGNASNCPNQAKDALAWLGFQRAREDRSIIAALYPQYAPRERLRSELCQDGGNVRSSERRCRQDQAVVEILVIPAYGAIAKNRVPCVENRAQIVQLRAVRAIVGRSDGIGRNRAFAPDFGKMAPGRPPPRGGRATSGPLSRQRGPG